MARQSKAPRIDARAVGPPKVLSLPLPRKPRNLIAVKQILCKVSLQTYGKNPMFR
jgi:hypothetical protein